DRAERRRLAPCQSAMASGAASAQPSIARPDAAAPARGIVRAWLFRGPPARGRAAHSPWIARRHRIGWAGAYQTAASLHGADRADPSAPLAAGCEDRKSV